jgi:hypothetical protein
MNAVPQDRIEKYADTRGEYWNIRHADRTFLLFCNPPMTQEEVLKYYPGAGVTKGKKP